MFFKSLSQQHPKLQKYFNLKLFKIKWNNKIANALRTFTKISFRGVGFKSIHIIHSIFKYSHCIFHDREVSHLGTQAKRKNSKILFDHVTREKHSSRRFMHWIIYKPIALSWL